MMMARMPEKPISSPFKGQRNHGPDATQQVPQGIDAVLARGAEEDIEKTRSFGGHSGDDSQAAR
jgi:hypothetical protein